MKKLWKSGRLSWLWVLLAVYCTASIVLFDYVWRLVVMPFPAMASAGFGAWLAGVFIIWLLFRTGGRDEHSA